MEKILKALQPNKHFTIENDVEIMDQIIDSVLCMDGIAFFLKNKEIIEVVYPRQSDLTFDDMTRIRTNRNMHISDRLSYGDIMRFMGKIKYTPPNE